MRRILEYGITHLRRLAAVRNRTARTPAAVSCVKTADGGTFKVGYALLPSIRLGQHWDLWGGLSLNYLRSGHGGDGRLLSSRPIWERQSPSLRQQLYVGYQAGIQYSF